MAASHEATGFLEAGFAAAGRLRVLEIPIMLSSALLPRVLAFTAAFSLAVHVAGTSAAGAAEPPAKGNIVHQISAEALAVAVVSQAGQTSQQLQQLGNRLGMPLPNPLEMLKQKTGVQQGLDETRPLAIALVAGNAGPPNLLVYLPTSDFEAIVRQLDGQRLQEDVYRVRVAEQPQLLAKHRDYAVFYGGEPDQLKRLLAPETTLGPQLDAVADFTGEAAAYAIVTSQGLQLLTAQGLSGLEQVKRQLQERGGDQAAAATSGIEFYAQMLRYVQQHVKLLAISTRITDDGSVYLSSRSVLSEPASQDADDIRPGHHDAAELLAKLRGGPYLFAMAGSTPEGMTQRWLDFSMQMFAAWPGGDQLTEDELAQIREASVASMKQMRAIAMAMLVPAEDAPLYSGFVLAMQVDDADAYLDDYAKSLEKMRAVTNKLENFPARFSEPERVQVADRPALKLVMEFAVEAIGQLPEAQQGELKKIFEKMYGPGGKMTFYLAAADKNTVVGAYGQQLQMEKALAVALQPSGGLAARADLESTVAMLPENAQWLMLLSVEGMLEFAQQAVDAFAPAEQRPNIPDFPNAPPAGFSMQFSSDAFETHLVLPAKLLDAAAKYGEQVRGQQ